MSIATVFLALNSTLAKIAMEYLPVFFYTGSRYMVIGAMFILLAQYRKERIVHTQQSIAGHAVQIALQAITGLAWMYGVSLTDPINASIAFLLSPILIYVGSVIFLGEPRSNKALAGSLIALVGGALLIGAPTLNGDGSQQMIGNGLLLLSAASLASLIIHTKKMYAFASRNYILGVRFFATGIVAFLLSIGLDETSAVGSASVEAWVALALAITLGGVIGLSIFYQALKHMRAEDSAALFYIDPLAGSVIAALVLGNTLSPAALVATSFIVLGVVVAHPVHIHRTVFYYLEHVSRFDQFVHWLKAKYLDLQITLKRLL